MVATCTSSLRAAWRASSLAVWVLVAAASSAPSCPLLLVAISKWGRRWRTNLRLRSSTALAASLPFRQPWRPRWPGSGQALPRQCPTTLHRMARASASAAARESQPSRPACLRPLHSPFPPSPPTRALQGLLLSGSARSAAARACSTCGAPQVRGARRTPARLCFWPLLSAPHPKALASAPRSSPRRGFGRGRRGGSDRALF
mmetsp:Transcript_26209/g.64939  ORF Transcript_26209/g.64939 Transcript_26209/m.64939 type:complete len:202 (-) Transcript_26209:270-875(-)